MAWTNPRTWVAAETVTAAIMNTHVRDNLNAITGASATYGTAATVWTATTTNPVIGNGTFVSVFRQDAKWVDGTVVITMGSTTTFGTGTWQILLPVTARFSGGLLSGRAIDSSAGTQGFPIYSDWSTTQLTLRCDNTVAGSSNRIVSPSNPMTWAVSDVLTLSFRYEAA